MDVAVGDRRRIAVVIIGAGRGQLGKKGNARPRKATLNRSGESGGSISREEEATVTSYLRTGL